MTQATPLFSNVNRNGGEVALASDANGVLHAVIRGVEGDQADWDLGATVYLTSTDNGETWTPFEYIDPDDDATPGSIGVSANISLALDANGVPAVTYWRYNSELWYARRDGPGGTWTRSLVTTMPGQSLPHSAQVRFDPAGAPAIAYFDKAANAVQIARPLPAGTTLPIDVSVSGTAVPATIQPGGDLTYVDGDQSRRRQRRSCGAGESAAARRDVRERVAVFRREPALADRPADGARIDHDHRAREGAQRDGRRGRHRIRHVGRSGHRAGQQRGGDRRDGLRRRVRRTRRPTASTSPRACR